MFIKYVSARNLQSALNLGRVRLGTIQEYQTTIDPDEGQNGFEIEASADEAIVLTTDESNALMQSPRLAWAPDWILKVGEGDRLRFAGARGINAHIFSMARSDHPSVDLMRCLNQEAAYEILDIEEFGTHLGKALAQAMDRRFGGFESGGNRVVCVHQGPVVYVDGRRNVVSPDERDLLTLDMRVDLIEFFTKTKDFEHESEYRLACFVANPDAEDQYTSHRELPIFAGGPMIPPLIREIEATEFHQLEVLAKSHVNPTQGRETVGTNGNH